MDRGHRCWTPLLEVSQSAFFDNALVVESKESNQGILYSLTSLNAKEEDEYYITFDYVSDN